jgi:hypothetical protein
MPHSRRNTASRHTGKPEAKKEGWLWAHDQREGQPAPVAQIKDGLLKLLTALCDSGESQDFALRFVQAVMDGLASLLRNRG